MEMMNNIRQTIEELRLKVKHNVGIISKNQDAIKQMLKHARSEEYAGQYEVYSNKNKELLTQNNDFINVQLTLVNFLEKYKNTAILDVNVPIVDIYSITDTQEIFALTIKEYVDFDEEHPHYNDLEFIEKLIVHYQAKENYEQCQKLNLLKEKVIST